jgi:hypothetical protein
MNRILLHSMIFLLFLTITCNGKAQQVSGRVTSFKNYTLQNVRVKSVKSGMTTMTDSTGKFSLEIIPGDVLLFSAEGFFERKVKVNREEVLSIDLKYKFGEGSFEEAVKNNHISGAALRLALQSFPGSRQKDYSKYQDIFALIRAEITNVRVSGTNVYSQKAISFSMSPQVLYVVNDMVVNDISYISPVEVAGIVFLEDNSAADYGIRGANGVIKITLKTH